MAAILPLLLQHQILPQVRPWLLKVADVTSKPPGTRGQEACRSFFKEFYWANKPPGYSSRLSGIRLFPLRLRLPAAPSSAIAATLMDIIPLVVPAALARARVWPIAVTVTTGTVAVIAVSAAWGCVRYNLADFVLKGQAQRPIFIAQFEHFVAQLVQFADSCLIIGTSILICPSFFIQGHFEVFKLLGVVVLKRFETLLLLGRQFSAIVIHAHAVASAVVHSIASAAMSQADTGSSEQKKRDHSKGCQRAFHAGFSLL